MTSSGSKRLTFAGPILLASACLLGSSETARASLFCEIRPTRDGFVALRGGPSPDAPLLRRMRPGDEVLLRPDRRGTWQHVTYWRGGRFRSGRNPAGDKPTAIGWMHKDLVAPDSCG